MIANKSSWTSELQSIRETVAIAFALGRKQRAAVDCCIKVSNYKTRNRKLHAAINFGVGGTVVSSLATALFSRRRQLVGVTSNFSNNKYFAILELHALSPLRGLISP